MVAMTCHVLVACICGESTMGHWHMAKGTDVQNTSQKHSKYRIPVDGSGPGVWDRAQPQACTRSGRVS